MFITNASVNDHNDNIFEKSRNDKAQIRAFDIIVGDISDELKQKVKNKIPDDATKTMGLHTLLSIAVGTKYDITCNIDLTDGMTNGAHCVIRKIDYRVASSERPSII